MLPSGLRKSRNRTVVVPFGVSSATEKRCSLSSLICATGTATCDPVSVTVIAGDKEVVLRAYINSAVVKKIKTNETVHTAVIHIRSRRAVHSALRRSDEGASAARATGARRRYSSSII